MNDTERRGFIYFLSLYLVSSFALLALSGWWYYSAQKQMIEKMVFYKLQNIADTVNTLLVKTQMNGQPFAMPKIPEGCAVTLIDAHKQRVSGPPIPPHLNLSQKYFRDNRSEWLISQGALGHHDVVYTVVQSTMIRDELGRLRVKVLSVGMLMAMTIAVIGTLLCRIFRRPVALRMQAMDRFIKDTAHELNTPITALRLTAQRAIGKGECDARLMRNISVSTKQLYEIYSSLLFLSFEQPRNDEPLDLAEIAAQSKAFFDEIAASKAMTIAADLEPTEVVMDRAGAMKLIGNLLDNAIKYSSRGSTVALSLHDRRLQVRDEGIGIDSEQIGEIFKRFQRANDYAGGFGIGLSIVADICRTYGIAIAVDSRPNQGSTFSLTFK